MNTVAVRSEDYSAPRPLRLWPGVLAAVVIVLLRFVIPLAVPDAMIYGLLGAAAGAAVILVWWLFFSRAPWIERIGALVVVVAAVFAVKPLLDRSIATGMMGRMFYVYAVPPVVAPVFVLWAVATRRLSRGSRWAWLAVSMVLACGVWTLFRTDGITGSAGAQIAWRWTETAEERLLAKGDTDLKPLPAAAPAPEPAPAKEQPPSPTAPASSTAPTATTSSPAATAAAKPEHAVPAPSAAPNAGDPIVVARAEWPGFRGAERDGVVRGTRIDTDWSAHPPVEIWRRPIGPGWSSFSLQGDIFYTQEQRGEEEIISAYRVRTGEPVWRHRDAARFWESNGGAGPRGTPTISNGRVYAFGATGILNVLDARTGVRVWSRNVGADAEKKTPMWGFSSSPLVSAGMVIVAAAGRLAAYDLATGKPRWLGPNGGGGYSSPQTATIGGVEQILFQSGTGAMGINPADGKVLWEYAWEGTPIVQPAVIAGGDVLVTSGDMMGGMGMRRIAVSQRSGIWTVQERWTSTGLKPYFNDFVVHKGHAFGFDGRILSCIDVADGTRKWKGGRFGQGQLVLLPDQDLLLVISEEGELGLVGATPDKFNEVARFKAIEGKTWNHPVLVGDVLLVRNDQEMAAFRLTRSGS